MSQFRVGQRVRVLAGAICRGREGVVIGPMQRAFDEAGNYYYGYPVDVDGVGRLNRSLRQMVARPHELAPLTDPGSERFIESIKKLAREPINTVAKEKA